VPKTDVFFYADERGIAPALEWMVEQSAPVQDKLWAHVSRLEGEGHALRRPIADALRDKVYELRVKHQRVNCRLLYFFAGRNVAVIAHACTKEGAVKDADIDRAVERRARFLANPAGHTYTEDDE